MKFKVGDRVKIINSDNNKKYIDQVAIIVEIYSSDAVVIKFLNETRYYIINDFLAHYSIECPEYLKKRINLNLEIMCK